MTEEDTLEEADELDLQARALSHAALLIRHKVLDARGWDIHRELIGGSYTYFYRRGDALCLCEFEALAEDDD